jgi:hypothetical protein
VRRERIVAGEHARPLRLDARQQDSLPSSRRSKTRSDRRLSLREGSASSQRALEMRPNEKCKGHGAATFAERKATEGDPRADHNAVAMLSLADAPTRPALCSADGT